MPTGALLAVLAYSIYSLGDSVVKSFGGGTLSVFEINVLINIFALASLPLVKTPEDRWRDVLKVKHPVLMHARALLYTAASLCFTFAVTNVPFAETYSLAFLAPLFLTALSAIILKEKVAALRWALVALSFVGVLVVVRPGFRDLQLGHLAAIGCAVFAACSNTLLRVVSNRERQVSIIAINGLYQIVAAGLLMIGNFVVPSLYDLFRLAVIGVLSGAAQMLMIRALQRAPASHVGPTVYVQIIWAVSVGALFYGETQDAIGFGGLALIILAGIATIFSDGAQARVIGRWTEFRARRGTGEVSRVDGPEV